MKNTFTILLMLLLACQQPQTTAGSHRDHKPQTNFTSVQISQVLTQMTEVMIHDITNPPLAARFFAYACLSGYEVLALHDNNLPGMHGVLKDYPLVQDPDSIKDYDVQVAAILAMLETAQKMQPSGRLVQQYEQGFIDSLTRNGFETARVNNAQRYAKAISKQILAYAKADAYNRISNYPRYAPLNKPGSWYPTPPAYMAAVEPYFHTVRPFVLDSCTQFIAPPPVPFSTGKRSPFYALMMKNVTASDQLTGEQKAIAAFWDCNPFAIKNEGHLMLSQKKISPGAHWLGIAGLACAKAGKSFAQSMQIHTLVAIGLTDAFISCWHEKYYGNRIRPETAIRQLVDPGWQPFLQTPPFPEYLSGHSVISSASAEILTQFFGNDFFYIDSVEVSYGLPPRQFSSFRQAAQEAAISRFYGGIHFMDAIDNGLIVGQQVGKQVITKLYK